MKSIHDYITFEVTNSSLILNREGDYQMLSMTLNSIFVVDNCDSFISVSMISFV